jgi:hypothetical protein
MVYCFIHKTCLLAFFVGMSANKHSISLQLSMITKTYENNALLFDSADNVQHKQGTGGLLQGRKYSYRGFQLHQNSAGVRWTRQGMSKVIV